MTTIMSTEAEAWYAQFPLRAKGRDLVNRMGHRFRLSGINWYGASDAFHVVQGLDVQALEVICESVAAIGLTVVRLPFSNEMLTVREVPEGVIDYTLNPGLLGLSPLEVYDCVIDALGRVGVAVVVNNHTTIGSWSGGVEPNGLWYLRNSKNYTEEKWIADWLTVAVRYADRPHVIGYDLRNEVRPVGFMATSPNWGAGGSTDWSLAAGRCARALMEVPGLPGLLIVERLAWPQKSLETMLQPTPPWEAWDVPRDRIVLALHMYSWSGPGSWLPKSFTKGIAKAFLNGVLSLIHI